MHEKIPLEILHTCSFLYPKASAAGQLEGYFLAVNISKDWLYVLVVIPYAVGFHVSWVDLEVSLKLKDWRIFEVDWYCLQRWRTGHEGQD